MECTIVVTVGVNSKEHSELIREDIIKVIKGRTTSFHVTPPKMATTFTHEQTENK